MATNLRKNEKYETKSEGHDIEHTDTHTHVSAQPTQR